MANHILAQPAVKVINVAQLHVGMDWMDQNRVIAKYIKSCT